MGTRIEPPYTLHQVIQNNNRTEDKHEQIGPIRRRGTLEGNEEEERDDGDDVKERNEKVCVHSILCGEQSS